MYQKGKKKISYTIFILISILDYNQLRDKTKNWHTDPRPRKVLAFVTPIEYTKKHYNEIKN